MAIPHGSRYIASRPTKLARSNLQHTSPTTTRHSFDMSAPKSIVNTQRQAMNLVAFSKELIAEAEIMIAAKTASEKHQFEKLERLMMPYNPTGGYIGDLQTEHIAETQKCARFVASSYIVDFERYQKGFFHRVALSMFKFDRPKQRHQKEFIMIDDVVWYEPLGNLKLAPVTRALLEYPPPAIADDDDVMLSGVRDDVVHDLYERWVFGGEYPWETIADLVTDMYSKRGCLTEAEFDQWNGVQRLTTGTSFTARDHANNRVAIFHGQEKGEIDIDQKRERLNDMILWLIFVNDVEGGRVRNAFALLRQLKNADFTLHSGPYEYEISLREMYRKFLILPGDYEMAAYRMDWKLEECDF